MNDRELLELAAKAAGLKFAVNGDGLYGYVTASNGDWRYGHVIWNPLQDDGDALRLAVKLGIKTGYDKNLPPELGLPRECGFAVTPSGQWFAESNPADPYASTRRAIVRAAAEIGKGIE